MDFRRAGLKPPAQRNAFGLAHPSRLLADFHELRQDSAKRPVGQSAETKYA